MVTDEKGILTFVAQLSLDFIFGGVSKLPDVGEEVMAEAFEIQLGGGTLVYPIVLSRLGIPCRVLVKKSNTEHSNLALKLLEQCGIKEIEVEETSFDPVMSTAVISMVGDRSFVSKNDYGAMKYSHEFLIDRFKDSKVVIAHFGNVELLPILKGYGCKVLFDVTLSDDLDIKDYVHILKYVDYFTPNDKEAMKLTNTETVEESLLVLSEYVEYPIITCGEDGCVALIDGEVVTVRNPENIMCVDTTGAGDNFVAGLIYGIYNDMEFIDILKFAVGAGALSTTKLGCYGARYGKEDIISAVGTIG